VGRGGAQWARRAQSCVVWRMGMAWRSGAAAVAVESYRYQDTDLVVLVMLVVLVVRLIGGWCVSGRLASARLLVSALAGNHADYRMLVIERPVQ
jgi:hypothetical protein